MAKSKIKTVRVNGEPYIHEEQMLGILREVKKIATEGLSPSESIIAEESILPIILALSEHKQFIRDNPDEAPEMQLLQRND
jgi:hypothetical protein